MSYGITMSNVDRGEAPPQSNTVSLVLAPMRSQIDAAAGKSTNDPIIFNELTRFYVQL